MVKWLVERKLADTSARLRKAREELIEIDLQAQHFAHEADDDRIRAMVSETPVADRELQESQRHADTMRRAKTRMLSRIADLERQQDDLLDRLSAAGR